MTAPTPATASLRNTNHLAVSLVRDSGKLAGEILDLGAGSGYLSSILAAAPERADKRPGEGLRACDIDGTKFSVPCVNFVECNINEGLPYPDLSFDAVIVIEVLEHTAVPYRVLMEIKRVLKPGGLLIFSVPNVGHMMSRFSFLIGGTTTCFQARALDRRMPAAFVVTLRRSPTNTGIMACGSPGIPKSGSTRIAPKRGRRLSPPCSGPLTELHLPFTSEGWPGSRRFTTRRRVSRAKPTGGPCSRREVSFSVP